MLLQALRFVGLEDAVLYITKGRGRMSPTGMTSYYIDTCNSSSSIIV